MSNESTSCCNHTVKHYFMNTSGKLVWKCAHCGSIEDNSRREASSLQWEFLDNTPRFRINPKLSESDLDDIRTIVREEIKLALERERQKREEAMLKSQFRAKLPKRITDRTK